MAEAVVALELARHVLRRFGGASFEEVDEAIARHRARVAQVLGRGGVYLDPYNFKKFLFSAGGAGLAEKMYNNSETAGSIEKCSSMELILFFMLNKMHAR